MHPQGKQRQPKEITGIFNDHGLRITIEVNKKIVNLLDVTLNLNETTHTARIYET